MQRPIFTLSLCLQVVHGVVAPTQGGAQRTWLNRRGPLPRYEESALACVQRMRASLKLAASLAGEFPRELSAAMVEGFVGPCMLGAMGIIFVAFLAPSGVPTELGRFGLLCCGLRARDVVQWFTLNGQRRRARWPCLLFNCVSPGGSIYLLFSGRAGPGQTWSATCAGPSCALNAR